jgi:membrane protein
MVRHYVRRAWAHSADDNVFFLASGIAFGLLLAALPFALLVITGLAAVLNLAPDASSAELRRLIDLLLPQHNEGPAESLHAFIDDLLRLDTRIGLWSGVGFVWFSSRLFGALRSALADVFDIDTERGILAGKLFDLRLTIVCSVLLIAYLVITAYLAIATSRGVRFLMALGIRRDVMGGVEYAIGLVLAFVVVVAVFYGLYRYLPVRRIHDGAALIGALTAAVLFELARVVFAWITTVLGPGTLYTGTLFAVVAVVFWVYYAAIIFLVGGEVARVHEIRLEAEDRLQRLTREHPAAPAS